EYGSHGFWPFPYIGMNFGLVPDRTGGDQTPEGLYKWRTELLPGDWINVLNPGADEPWHNENAIYIGKDKDGTPMFFSHPFGITTLKQIQDSLSKAFRDQ